MKFIVFSLFLTIFVSTVGCNAENPICSTNFCAIGEVFPRSELEADQAFSEVDIDDSIIFATLVGATPIEATPVTPPIQPTSTTFANIVADAAAGGTKYVGNTVTVTAPVRFVLEGGVSLVTKNELVTFYVKSLDAPEKLDALVEGKTYQFTIEITSIAPPDEEFDTYAVFSDITGDATLVNVSPVDVTVATLAADVAAGGRTYVGQTVKVDATVALGTAETETAGLGLATNNNDVVWIVVHKDKTTLDPYVKDLSYTFTLLIDSVTPPDPLDVDQYYTINSIFVEAE